MSRIELELGEKWFQRIGILVLAVAFLFLLVIVLPNLAPVQIIGINLGAAVALGLLGEYVYRVQNLKEYGKGLELGAFGLASIGLWGGGFFYNLAGFPWPVLLAAALILHGLAALRYRSPVLAIEAALLLLAWITWLRAIDVLLSSGYAILLSEGAFAILGLVYLLKDERSALFLVFTFDAVALVGAPLLAPYGWIPVLSVGFVTVIVLTLFRLEKVLALPKATRLPAWAVGIVLTYAILFANAFMVRDRGGIDDLTIFVAYGTLTAAFTASEILAAEERVRLPFAALMGVLSFPVPLLMGRGELALTVYPALLLALLFIRQTKGLAWFANLVYLGLILFAGAGLEDPLAQYAVVWGLLFAAMALHVLLQERSGYAGPVRDVPTDLQVPLFVVALAGLTARLVPGDASAGMYAFAMPLAILLNRQALRGPPWKIAAVVGTLAVAASLGRAWALAPLLSPGIRPAADLANLDLALGLYHVGLLLALGVYAGLRRSVSVSRTIVPALELRVAWPAFALLFGLLAQDVYVAPLFLVLPAFVLGLAFLLDDALTFNLAFLALAGQAVVALESLGAPASEALGFVPGFAAALLALGFVLELASRRRVLARGAQLTSGIFWFAAAPLAFGAQVETTVLWTAAGGVAVAWGLWRKFPTMRYVGFALFFVVLGKVFLYDVAGLAIELRVLGLIVVAAALLVISYAYASYRKRQAAGA